MIGGYIYNLLDKSIDNRLKSELNSSFNKIRVENNGYLFYDRLLENHTFSHISNKLTILTQDLLVTMDSAGEYVSLDIQNEFPEIFTKEGTNSFKRISSDYRMAIFKNTENQKSLHLVSNRAGSGRIYYHKMESGILFSSDLRFLLKIINFDVNRKGIYSILKYGAIPEPMTISNNISAIPPAHFLEYDLKINKILIDSYFKFEFKYPHNQESPRNYHPILESTKGLLKKSARFLNEYEPSILLSGGIDSSLYACYLAETGGKRFKGFYCSFDDEDPEFQFAKSISERVDANFNFGIMKKDDAINTLEDVVQLTDHPFNDFSSLPVTFIIKLIREYLDDSAIIIECNGGDDCFGFQALNLKSKYLTKHHFPKFLKSLIASTFKNTPYWKWDSHGRPLARLLSLADVHENNLLNYFLVQPPLNYLSLRIQEGWDEEIEGLMEDVFSSCSENYDSFGYKAHTTVRQLIHINSRLWTAKALSVGESLGLKVVYPYIWQEVLIEQGKVPWDAKIHNGIIKWPLKKLLEEFMPKEFIYRKKSGFVPPFARWLTYQDFNKKVRDILLVQNGYITEIVPVRILDELLSDALNGKKLGFPILNFLWAALFAEMWIQEYKQN
ncbi:MAG: asparagine synthase [Proteobacteria bacterium]|nr:asparagine synthase [Pseudomonadota bacterium]MBU4259940.1 asparagine synthase [Pseudomonadota bacterium]MBU4286579.1 asparagine synthase [Pseudomonadota bacterium]MCG2758645.1 asparagine synthetase B family protein [Desulfobacteraceae bacterium]